MECVLVVELMVLFGSMPVVIEVDVIVELGAPLEVEELGVVDVCSLLVMEEDDSEFISVTLFVFSSVDVIISELTGVEAEEVVESVLTDVTVLCDNVCDTYGPSDTVAFVVLIGIEFVSVVEILSDVFMLKGVVVPVRCVGDVSAVVSSVSVVSVCPA